MRNMPERNEEQARKGIKEISLLTPILDDT
jgi:hypothetical protein